ncbi:hypothetical protein CBS101457_000638 [Exobasidium rhododendri]|nr:hypothetical protein CBS101457_000638 [Exobasidium rhododendri]
MRAVIIKEPYKVSVEDRPIPRVKEPTDVVVRNRYSALCGSDLHIYHGHQPVPHYDFTLGHEFVGTVSEVGAEVKKFKKGDMVVSPFTISCGSCFFCDKDQTSRCVQSRVFGSVPLEGAQAEFVLVPLADTTLYHVPEGAAPELLLLMADIFPTGYFVASNAYNILNEKERNDVTAVVIGCGPVGLCAITAATHFFKNVYAIDSVPDRLEEAKKHGAKEAFHLTDDDPVAKIKELTGGRGADVVCEVVGVEPALHMAVDLIRNFGVISSCGIHTQPVKFKGLDLYNKNIRFQFGRCPVRALFKPALDVLLQHEELFKTFIHKTVSIEDAVEYYDLFDKRKVRKTVFKFD